MGLDPTDPDYEAGVICALCVDVIFNGVTPKYVWANISGVLDCATSLLSAVNGTYKLTQDPVAKCYFLGSYDPFQYILNLGPFGYFEVREILNPGNFWFQEKFKPDCSTSFANQLVCGSPPFGFTFQGVCTITWGPENPCP